MRDPWANSAWQVTAPFRAYERVGTVPSNTSVGSCQLCGNVYREVEVRPGDVILGLCGGDFLVRGGQDAGGRLLAVPIAQAVSEKHPFEKTYGGSNRPFAERWAGKPIAEDPAFYIGANLRYELAGEDFTVAPAGAIPVGRNIDLVIPLGS